MSACLFRVQPTPLGPYVWFRYSRSFATPSFSVFALITIASATVVPLVAVAALAGVALSFAVPDLNLSNSLSIAAC
jgi:hypothetical protein